MIHTRIAETSTAMAFLEEVPVNQMHELKASIIDMAAGLVRMGQKQEIQGFTGFATDDST